MKRFFTVVFLTCLFKVFATDVQFNLTDPQYGVSQTTNRLVTVQAESGNAQSGTIVLLPFQLSGYTDTNGQIVFSNLYGSAIAGWYHVSIPAPPQRADFDIWVQSTNLGLVQASTLIGVWGASTYPNGSWAWSAQTSDLRYSASTNQLTNYVQIGQLTSTSNSIVALIPSTNGFASLQQATNIAGVLYTNNPLGYATNSVVTTAISNTNQTTLIVATGLVQTASVNSTNYSLLLAAAGSNNVNTVSNALTVSYSSAIAASSNSVFAFANGASNLLQGTKMQSNAILNNLSFTGAFTNSIAAGTNVSLSTNIGGGTVFINATNQTFLTNGLASIVYAQSLTNGFVTSAVTNGLVGPSVTNGMASTAYAQSLTNGLVGSAITNGLAATSFVASSISSSNANLATYSAVSSTNTATLTLVTNSLFSIGLASSNLSYSIGQQSTNYSVATSNLLLGVVLQNVSATNTANLILDTNLIQASANNSTNYTLSASNSLNGLVYQIGLNETNFAIANSNGLTANYLLAISTTNTQNLYTTTNIANGAFQSASNYANSLFSTNSPQFVASTNGAATSLIIQSNLYFGTKNAFALSTNVIGIVGSGSKMDGTYFGVGSNWTNVFNSVFQIVLTGGNYYLQSNAVSFYQSTNVVNWTIVSGAANAPSGSFGTRWHMDGANLEGVVYSTNLIQQMQQYGGTTNFNLSGFATGPTTNTIFSASASNYIFSVASLVGGSTNGITAATATNIAVYQALIATNGLAPLIWSIGANGTNFTVATSNTLYSLLSGGGGGSGIATLNGFGTNTTIVNGKSVVTTNLSANGITWLNNTNLEFSVASSPTNITVFYNSASLPSGAGVYSFLSKGYYTNGDFFATNTGVWSFYSPYSGGTLVYQATNAPANPPNGTPYYLTSNSIPIVGIDGKQAYVIFNLTPVNTINATYNLDIESFFGVSINTNSAGTNALEVNGYVNSEKGFTVNGVPYGQVAGITNTTGPVNTTTNGTTFDPAVANYFGGCDSTVTTNYNGFVHTTFLSTLPNYYQYNALPAGATYTVSGFGVLNPDYLTANNQPIYESYFYNVYTPNPSSITTNTPTTPSQNLTALNDLVANLKSAGLWNLFTNGAIYPFAGGNSTCDAQNLVGTNYTLKFFGTLTNQYAHTSLGLVASNNIFGYADTGFKFTAASQTNSSLIVYTVNQGAGATNSLIASGVSGGGGADQSYIAASASGSFFSSSISAGITLTSLTATSTNFYGVVDNGTNIFALLGATNFLSAALSGTATPPSSNIVLLAGAGYGYVTNATLGFAAIGPALTTNQLKTLQGIVQQYEVEMGRLPGGTYVSTTFPSTPQIGLAQLPSGVVTNNPEAEQFIIANNVTDISAQRDLNEAVSELKRSGAWTSVVSMIPFQSRFGAVASLVGTNPVITGPITQSFGGLVMSGTTTGYVSIPALSNYTVCAQYKITDTNLTLWTSRGGGSPVWALKDPATLCEQVFGEDGYWGRTFSSRNNSGSVTNFGSINWLDVQTYNNALQIGQIVNSAVTRDSGNLVRYWNSSRPGYWDNSGSLTTNAFCTNSLSQIWFGWETNIVNLKPAALELHSLIVLNTNATQAQINSAYRAAMWLESGSSLVWFGGDSRLSQYFTGTFNNRVDWPGIYFQKHPNALWMNQSRGGTTTRHLLNNPVLGGVWDFREVTNLPSSKFTDLVVVSDLGINDFYINNSTANEVQTNLNYTLSPLRSIGIRLGWADIYDVSTNNANWSYSLANLTNSIAVNEYVGTNDSWSYYWPFSAHITQRELYTNNMFSLTQDGVHFGFGNTNSFFSYYMAGIFDKRWKPSFSPYLHSPLDYNGPLTDGGSITNLQSTNLVGVINQGLLPSGVVTNNEPSVTFGAISGVAGSLNVTAGSGNITSATATIASVTSGNFNGNGSGITNIPITAISTNGSTAGQMPINMGNGTVGWTNQPSGGISYYSAWNSTNIVMTTNSTALVQNPFLSLSVPAGVWSINLNQWFNDSSGGSATSGEKFQLRFSPAVTNYTGRINCFTSSGINGSLNENPNTNGIATNTMSFSVTSIGNYPHNDVAIYTIWATNTTTIQVWQSAGNASAAWTTNGQNSVINATKLQ